MKAVIAWRADDGIAYASPETARAADRVRQLRNLTGWDGPRPRKRNAG